VSACGDCSNISSQTLPTDAENTTQFPSLSETENNIQSTDYNLLFEYNISNFIPLGNQYEEENYFVSQVNESVSEYGGSKEFSGRAKNGLIKNWSSEVSAMRVHINSRKTQQENSVLSPSRPQYNIKRTRLRTPKKSESVTRHNGRKIGPLLTRQFLKNIPRHTTQFTSTASPSALTTQRVRSRMSRDNRRFFQTLERQDNLLPDKLRTGKNPSREGQQQNRMAKARGGGGGQLRSSHQSTSREERLHQTHTKAHQSKSPIRVPVEVATLPPAYSNYNQNTLQSARANKTLQEKSYVAVSGGGVIRKRPTQHYPSLPIIQPLQQNNKPKTTSKLHQTGRKVQLSGSSSSPVEPIKPLLQLGGRGGGVLPQHPVFDEAAPRNLSGLTGSAAYLHCLVHNLANRSVSISLNYRDLGAAFIRSQYYSY